MDVKTCLEKGFLVKIKSDKDLIEKDMAEAIYDFEKAEKAFEEKDFKWCIIKSYYAMFHIARALLFKLGLREKRHFAIGIVLEDLNKQGKLESKYIHYFNAVASSREDADYHYKYSEDVAEHNLKIAGEFLDKIKGLIRKDQ